MSNATTESFNRLCRLIGERNATAELADRGITAEALLAELQEAATENGESIKTFVRRLYDLD
jgi:hypothetical protein